VLSMSRQPVGSALQGLSVLSALQSASRPSCRLTAVEPTLLRLRGLRVSGISRSALLLRHSRFAVRRLSGLPTSPHHRGALQPLSRGRHRPTTEFLLKTHAPLQGLSESQPPARTSACLRRLPGVFRSVARRDTPVTATGRGGRQPSWASFPFSAYGVGDPHDTGLAKPATVRPQRFSRSRRFSPPETSPGLFHPGNALGISSSGLCSSRRADSLSGTFPLLPFAGARRPARATRPVRLQSLALFERPCLPGSCYASVKAVSLLTFEPSRALPFSAAGSG